MFKHPPGLYLHPDFHPAHLLPPLDVAHPLPYPFVKNRCCVNEMGLLLLSPWGWNGSEQVLKTWSPAEDQIFFTTLLLLRDPPSRQVLTTVWHGLHPPSVPSWLSSSENLAWASSRYVGRELSDPKAQWFLACHRQRWGPSAQPATQAAVPVHPLLHAGAGAGHWLACCQQLSWRMTTNDAVVWHAGPYHEEWHPVFNRHEGFSTGFCRKSRGRRTVLFCLPVCDGVVLDTRWPN